MAAPLTESNHAFAPKPHFACPGGEMVAYLTEPPGVVIQLPRPIRLTESHARWIIEHVVPAMLKRFPGEHALVFVLDLRFMLSREVAARNLLLQRAQEMHRHLGCLYLVPPANTGAVVGTTLFTAAALLRAVGVQVVVERSLRVVVASTGLLPAR
jgi:hypothetical protein